MIMLRPDRVTFGSAAWPGVERLAVDRVGTRVVRAWTEGGPFPTFADVTEQTVRVRVVQSLDQTDLNAPAPGDRALLRAELSRGGDERRRLLRVDAVVESVTHEIGPRAATRTVTLTAVSDDADEDPVVLTAL